VEGPIVVAAAESHLAGSRSRCVAEEEGIDLEEVHHSRLVVLQTVAEGHRNLLGVEGSHHVVVDLVEGSPGRSLGPEEGNLRMEVGLEADRMTFAVRKVRCSCKVG
jgi:hypothetical protein